MNSCSAEEFIRDYAKAIQESKAALFIGSGLSRSAGYTDWRGILREAATDIGLSVEKEDDLISLAEYYVNEKKNRAKINSAISEYFSEGYPPTETHKILASLGITSWWTTNYDQLIERTFRQQERQVSVLTNDNSFCKFSSKNAVTVHKLHGDVESPEEAVITKKDYEEFVPKHEVLLAKLKGEMCSKSFLFLGYSFSDTDIHHILACIRLFYQGSPPQIHYNIAARVQRDSNETVDEFAYRVRKQEHYVADLKSYGIHTVLLDSYDEIPSVLLQIRQRVFAQNVFVSGAYIAGSDAEDSARFGMELSEWLVAKKFQIYTGYGNQLGSDIIAGAYEACCKSRTARINLGEILHICPFPYRRRMLVREREALYSELRKDMISQTRITVVINGTKKLRRGQINSPGVLEEAEISEKQGNIIIPIAYTGGAAREVWERLKAKGASYTQSKEFDRLKDGPHLEDVLDAAKNLIVSAASGQIVVK